MKIIFWISIWLLIIDAIIIFIAGIKFDIPELSYISGIMSVCVLVLLVLFSPKIR
jgi:hypothetical protein